MSFGNFYKQGSSVHRRIANMTAGGTTRDNSVVCDDVNGNGNGFQQTVSIVIPCFNEIDSLDRLADGLRRLQNTLGPVRECRFILVDDGSSDGTAAGLETRFAGQTNFCVIKHATNQGISAAIRSGIMAADTDVVCSIDSDCSYDPVQLEAMIPSLEAGSDLVTASPYHPDGQVLNVPAWRLWISQIASRMYRLVLRENLYTYTSCFRVYRRDTFVSLDYTEAGFVGVAEVVWRFDQAGAKIVEHPAVLDVRKFGQSKMRVVKVTADHLRLMARIAAWRLGSFFGLAAKSPSVAGVPTNNLIENTRIL